MLALLKKFNNSDDGFTLIELLIVVLIIGILAAISIPVYLGIQTQAKHSAVKSDVNITVKKVQVGLTEGAVTIPTTASSTPISGYSDSTARSDGDTVVTTPLGNGDFQVQGTGTDGYTYTYSSVTGQFTEGSSGGVAFGGGTGTNIAPQITSAPPTGTATVGSSYSYAVVANGTPNPTYKITSGALPTGLNLNTVTGVINGSPTTAGTYNFTVSATNGTAPDATQNGTIVVSAATGLVSYTFESGTQGWTSYLGSISQSSAQANSGSYSLALNPNGSSFTGTRGPALTGLTAGNNYTLNGYIYLASGQTATIYEVASSGGTNVRTYITGTGSWQSFSLPFTYHTGDYLQVAGPSPSTGITTYIDDFNVN